MVPPFYRWGSWRTESLRNPSKVTKVVSLRVGIWNQIPALESRGQNLFKNLLIYLFDCSGSWLWHVGSSSWPGLETRAPCIGSWSLSHWTTKEVWEAKILNTVLTAFLSCHFLILRSSKKQQSTGFKPIPLHSLCDPKVSFCTTHHLVPWPLDIINWFTKHISPCMKHLSTTSIHSLQSSAKILPLLRSLPSSSSPTVD